MRVVVLGLLLAGCGRIAFDEHPPSDGQADMTTIDAPGGPVAYYTFESLIGGMQLADATGHNHLGTCAIGQCPSVVGGKVGNALHFDGNDDHFTVAVTPELEGITGFTVSSWVNLDAAGVSGGCIVSKLYAPATSDGNSWQVCIYDDLRLFFYSVDLTGSDLLDATVPMTRGAWHHAAIRWDGLTKSVWLDGQRVALRGALIDFDGSSIVIGSDIDLGGRVSELAAAIDEVTIWDHALSDAEIQALAVP